MTSLWGKIGSRQIGHKCACDRSGVGDGDRVTAGNSSTSIGDDRRGIEHDRDSGDEGCSDSGDGVLEDIQKSGDGGADRSTRAMVSSASERETKVF